MLVSTSFVSHVRGPSSQGRPEFLAALSLLASVSKSSAQGRKVSDLKKFRCSSLVDQASATSVHPGPSPQLLGSKFENSGEG